MTHDLVIIGCGGFGRESVDVIDSINIAQPIWNLVGFLDDSPSDANLDAVARLGLSVLGSADSDSIAASTATHYVIGIGDGEVRRSLAARANDSGLEAATLIDSRAHIGRDVQIGPGTIIAAQTHVTTNVILGEHVHVDRASQIGHDSVIGDFVTIHPGAVVSGNCTIRDGTQLGTHSTVLPGVTIGSEVTVGAAACVVSNTSSGRIVKGVPAR